MPGVVVLPGFVDVPGVGEVVPEFGEVVSGVGEAVPGVGEAVPGVGEAVLPEFGVVLSGVPGLVPVCPGLDVVPGVCPLFAPEPACPAFDPVEEPVLEPVDPAEPADPAEPDCPVSATTQHVKSNKTAIIEIFVFNGASKPPKGSNANSRSTWSVGRQFRSENPADSLGFASRCGRNSPASVTARHMNRRPDKPAAGKEHPTLSCLP